MDPAEARRQAQTLDALRRLEDIVGDTNRGVVRLEGILRDLRSTMFDGHKQILQQALGIRNDLAKLLGDEGGAGVREPAPPAPESPGDRISRRHYGESAE